MKGIVLAFLVAVNHSIDVLGVALTYSGRHSKVNSFEDRHRVKRGEFPFIVDIENGLCTGTFISDQWILTSAHCITSETIKVSYGSNRRKDLIDTQGVTIRHPYYHVSDNDYIDEEKKDEENEASNNNKDKSSKSRKNRNAAKYKIMRKITRPKITEMVEEPSEEKFDNTYDIGLIMLEETVSDIVPVFLPKNTSAFPQVNDSAVIVGWGVYRLFEQNGVFLNTYTEEKPKFLRMSNVTLRSPYECLEEYTADMERKICAGSMTTNSCPGDSGSPLLINGVQWGIDSFGKGNIQTIVHEWNRDRIELKNEGYCNAGPDVYLSTWHYLEWISCVTDKENVDDLGVKFVGLYCAIWYP